MQCTVPGIPRRMSLACQGRPFKVTLWAIGESGGVQVAESQLFAGCPCWWKDGTEKKEVVDSQGDIPHH